MFVTAVSSNHFDEMTVGLYHVRLKFGVNKTVVVYDIGLEENLCDNRLAATVGPVWQRCRRCFEL